MFTLSKLHKRRLTISLIVLSAVGVIVGLILTALSQNINVFYAPSSLLAADITQVNTIRLGGMVVPGSIQETPGSVRIVFELKDEKASIPVVYEGLLPDLFREGQGIVAEGHYDGQYFNASLVLAKHDENYMPKVR